MGMRSVHKPIRRREPCLTCHGVHDLGYGKLLADDNSSLCARCHDGPSLFLHQDKLEGCTFCHTAHASKLPTLMVVGADQPCRECHEELWEEDLHGEGKGDGKARSSGSRKNKGCFSCHQPHQSFEGQEVSKTCGECHRPNDEGMAFFHAGLPMEGTMGRPFRVPCRV